MPTYNPQQEDCKECVCMFVRSLSSHVQRQIASKWLRVHHHQIPRGVLGPSGSDADSIWSCRQGGFFWSRTQDPDAGRTPGEGIGQQEVWLLSAEVGEISANFKHRETKSKRIMNDSVRLANKTFLLRMKCWASQGFSVVVTKCALVIQNPDKNL